MTSFPDSLWVLNIIIVFLPSIDLSFIIVSCNLLNIATRMMEGTCKTFIF